MRNSLISLLFLVFITALFLFPAAPLHDADTGWHIMAGHYMVNNHIIPQINVFSYTAGNYRWLNVSWLWDVIMAEFDTWGGLYFASVIAIFTGGLIIALLAWLCLQNGAGAIATSFVIGLGGIAFAAAVMPRPHLVTVLFMLLFTIIMQRFDSDPKSNRKYLLLLPLIMVLWANMHGGFLSGFTIIGAYFIQYTLEKKFASARLLAVCGIVTLLAVFANPWGVDIFTIVYRVLGGPLKPYIGEWRSPTNWDNYLYLGLAAFIWVVTAPKNKLAEKIIVAFWLVEAFLALRNLPIFIVASAPMLARGVDFLFGEKPKFIAWEARYKKFLSLNAVSNFSIGAVVFAILFFASPEWKNITNFSLESENYPKKEIDFALQNYPDQRYLNSYGSGGYVIYESQGKIKTFMDGRAETAFPPETVNDYLKYFRKDKDWEKILDKYQVNGAIVNDHADMAFFKQNPGWRQVYDGGAATIFIKN